MPEYRHRSATIRISTRPMTQPSFANAHGSAMMPVPTSSLNFFCGQSSAPPGAPHACTHQQEDDVHPRADAVRRHVPAGGLVHLRIEGRVLDGVVAKRAVRDLAERRPQAEPVEGAAERGSPLHVEGVDLAWEHGSTSAWSVPGPWQAGRPPRNGLFAPGGQVPCPPPPGSPRRGWSCAPAGPRTGPAPARSSRRPPRSRAAGPGRDAPRRLGDSGARALALLQGSGFSRDVHDVDGRDEDREGSWTLDCLVCGPSMPGH